MAFELTLVEYVGLALEDGWGPPSLQCVVLNRATGEEVESEIIEGEAEPEWNQAFTMKMKKYETEILTFSIFDMSREEGKDQIGTVSMKLSNAPKDELYDDWFDLRGTGEGITDAGGVHILLKILEENSSSESSSEDVAVPLKPVPSEEEYEYEDEPAPTPAPTAPVEEYEYEDEPTPAPAVIATPTAPVDDYEYDEEPPVTPAPAEPAHAEEYDYDEEPAPVTPAPAEPAHAEEYDYDEEPPVTPATAEPAKEYDYDEEPAPVTPAPAEPAHAEEYDYDEEPPVTPATAAAAPVDDYEYDEEPPVTPAPAEPAKEYEYDEEPPVTPAPAAAAPVEEYEYDEEPPVKEHDSGEAETAPVVDAVAANIEREGEVDEKTSSSSAAKAPLHTSDSSSSPAQGDAPVTPEKEKEEQKETRSSEKNTESQGEANEDSLVPAESTESRRRRRAIKKQFSSSSPSEEELPVQRKHVSRDNEHRRFRGSRVRAAEVPLELTGIEQEEKTDQEGENPKMHHKRVGVHSKRTTTMVQIKKDQKRVDKNIKKLKMDKKETELLAEAKMILTRNATVLNTAKSELLPAVPKPKATTQRQLSIQIEETIKFIQQLDPSFHM